jgi:hypothetical protein
MENKNFLAAKFGIEVEFTGITRRQAYIMTDEVMERIQLNLPSRSYLETVRVGYAMAGFDNKYIEAALDISRKEQDLRNRERRQVR